MPAHSNGWRGWLLGFLTVVSMAVGGWYGSTVWTTQSAHAERITRTETRVDSLHETLKEVKTAVERVNRRLERRGYALD